MKKTLILFSLPFLLLSGSEAKVGNVVRQITVTALDTEGELIGGAAVFVCNIDISEDDCAIYNTGETGSVDLEIQPNGHYEIRVQIEGFLPTTLGPLMLRESERDWVDYPNLVAVLNPEIVY